MSINNQQHEDELLKLCIKQGYVPNHCKLDGMLIYGLVQNGRTPCIGCNVQCPNNIYSNNESHSSLYSLRSDHEKAKLQRINKRNKLKQNSNPIVFVEVDYNQVTVQVLVPNEERGYSKRFDSASETARYIPTICHLYHAQQCFIEKNGMGVAILDSLEKEEIEDIDIVPIFTVAMKKLYYL